MSDFKVRKVFTQSGVSLAVVIPKDYAEELDLIDGSKVYFSIQGDLLVIKKVPEFLPSSSPLATPGPHEAHDPLRDSVTASVTPKEGTQ